MGAREIALAVAAELADPQPAVNLQAAVVRIAEAVAELADAKPAPTPRAKGATSKGARRGAK